MCKLYSVCILCALVVQRRRSRWVTLLRYEEWINLPFLPSEGDVSVSVLGHATQAASENDANAVNASCFF